MGTSVGSAVGNAVGSAVSNNVALAVFGAVVGTTVGIMQWLVLRRQIEKAGGYWQMLLVVLYWVLCSMLWALLGALV
ncbi:MAG: hypothetical protein ACREPR_00095 [Brasilonema sp.]